MDAPLLDVRGISKTFPGQRALIDADLQVGRGEIVGLAGANGSGKSTLVKILAGYHHPDGGGEIHAFGERVFPDGPPGWRRRCHFIHQDLGLVLSLSAAENLALGSGYETGTGGRISWRRQRAVARKAIRRFGGTFDVTLPVQELTLAERTVVAIARAMAGWDSADALLIVDEPTAALHGDEAEKLFTVIRQVASEGAGVVFVSHRLQEILSLTNRVVVLRDGRVVATRNTSDLTHDALVELIAGRRVADLYAEPPPAGDDVVLAVRDLVGTRLRGLSFDLHRGEILGVTGLTGSGREELPGLIYGATAALAGSVAVSGRKLRTGGIGDAIEAGIALVPSDRARRAVVLTQTVRENVMLPDLWSVWRHGHVDRRAERAEVQTWIERMEVRPPRQDRRVDELSGGNQQKVVLAKWLRMNPSVLLLDEPTAGVDVGSKAAIHRHLADVAADGTALLVCSSEAKDLAAMCDRVLVLCDGELTAELHGRSLTEQEIIRESLGGRALAAVMQDEGEGGHGIDDRP
jgi:ABC-type sugar transport system ATPase subunit